MASRNPEALRHHFEVEKELAARLRSSRREERAELVPRLYSELYERVPDHPRKVPGLKPFPEEGMFRSRRKLLQPFLSTEVDFAEFGAGDGGLCRMVAKEVRSAVALEVCDQTDGAAMRGEGLRWVYYDGLHIPLPDASFDVVFSYQVLEHIHPDDVPVHLAEAARLLRPGGVYVLSTPHAFSGPHDISRFFTNQLETFHLKEWTYGELSKAMRDAGFETVVAYFKGHPWPRFGMAAWRACEVLLGLAPSRIRRRLARRFLNNVVIAAARGGADKGAGPQFPANN